MSDLKERIRKTIESEDVVLFMKGTPERVFCGNSARALDALRAVGAPVTAVDVLPDPRIREELSALSNWPTIPQVFVRGELVGGADIVEELAATGELRARLESAFGDDWSPEAREERVIDIAGGPSRLPLVP
jgi:monothiol glutaredoxin